MWDRFLILIDSFGGLLDFCIFLITQNSKITSPAMKMIEAKVYKHIRISGCIAVGGLILVAEVVGVVVGVVVGKGEVSGSKSLTVEVIKGVIVVVIAKVAGVENWLVFGKDVVCLVSLL